MALKTTWKVLVLILHFYIKYSKFCNIARFSHHPTTLSAHENTTHRYSSVTRTVKFTRKVHEVVWVQNVVICGGNAQKVWIWVQVKICIILKDKNLAISKSAAYKLNLHYLYFLDPYSIQVNLTRLLSLLSRNHKPQWPCLLVDNGLSGTLWLVRLANMIIRTPGHPWRYKLLERDTPVVNRSKPHLVRI